MPQIIVTADNTDGSGVMLRERVNVTDFESEHFAAQLVERIHWAVEDADDLEHGETDTCAAGSDVVLPRRDLELAH